VARYPGSPVVGAPPTQLRREPFQALASGRQGLAAVQNDVHTPQLGMAPGVLDDPGYRRVGHGVGHHVGLRRQLWSACS
jgi:hypothetical protein